jgi:vacuolar-type H+-ATPase subunit B/Vma2
LHEEIETQCIASVAVVRAVQKSDELLGEAVSEGDERFVEFSERYASRMILVEAVEKAAPGGEEAP